MEIGMTASNIALTSGCYCGAVRYRAEGKILTRGICFCRECQHISGGGGSVIMAMPSAGFSYTSGEPAQFTRPDLDTPGTREFCDNCGTHLITRSPRMKDAVLIKVGSIDDQTVYGMPGAIVYTSEKQAYHCLPEGVPTFEKFPAPRPVE
jgi:hypothetical protein